MLIKVSILRCKQCREQCVAIDDTPITPHRSCLSAPGDKVSWSIVREDYVYATEFEKASHGRVRVGG